MDHIPRLSEILYVGLSRFEIGTPSELTIRRDVSDVEDLLHRKRTKRKNECPVRLMLSGSHREGFRLNSSDMDYMSWVDCFKVINDLCQLRDYNPSIHHNIMLMEDTDISPGFVRLQLLTPPRSDYLRSLFIILNDRFYISNLLWRQWTFHNFFSNYNLQSSCLHGPCTSGYKGTIQYDHTLCVFCKYWPSTTGNWIKRCLSHKCPSANVLKDILNNGYHCVAIGSKCTTSRNDLEWRLSFSMAELKLVYTMNHNQFICYGLLKIFLSEVINKNVEEPLLCSYFMKTTMFWLIQVGHMNWCPNNLLKCFWMCFKYLILCVYRGKFENFFIPQNNMFLNKIVGVARESLLEQLYQYYRLGVSSLLLSPTLRSILEPALSDLTSVIPSLEGHCNDIACIDRCVRNELSLFGKFFYDLEDISLFLKSVDTLLQLSLSPYQSVTIQYWTAECLALAAFMIVNSVQYFKHKYVYCLDRKLCSMLKLSSQIGTICHSLYLALYYYRTGRYNEALYITNQTKRRLSQPHVMHSDIRDSYRYRECMSGLSLSERIKGAWAMSIRLHPEICYIEELTLEQSVLIEKIMTFPPSVLVQMLSVLSHYKLGNRSQCSQSLTDLHTLLFYDEGTCVPLFTRDISWQILGICQQVVGDLHGALRSYRESLKENPRHKLQKATKLRIEYIQDELCRNLRE